MRYCINQCYQTNTNNPSEIFKAGKEMDKNLNTC